MTAVAWPGLGFDPAPGDPAAASALAQRLAAGADGLDASGVSLAAAAAPDGGWAGPAATAFAGHVAALAGGLAAERPALLRAADVLRAWSRALSVMQARARDLEARARVLAGPATAALVAEAAVLRREHAEAARAAAAALREPPDGQPPPRPAADRRAADHLGTVGDVAGTVAGVAGALAFVPVLTPVAAPVALAAGVVALAADVADHTVHHTWSDPRAVTDVAVDALSLVPGVRFVKGLAGATSAAADLSAAAFRGIDGLGTTVTAGAAVFARAEADASAVYREPGVWSVLRAKVLAAGSPSPIDVDAAARRIEIASRIERARSRAARLTGSETGTSGVWPI